MVDFTLSWRPAAGATLAEPLGGLPHGTPTGAAGEGAAEAEAEAEEEDAELIVEPSEFELRMRFILAHAVRSLNTR